MSSKIIYEKAYFYTESYLTQKLGNHNTSHAQIKALTHRTFEDLKTHHPKSYKKITAQLLKGKDKYFKKSFENVLVSAKTPWKPHLKNLNPRQKLVLELIQGNMPATKILLKDQKLISAILFRKNALFMHEARTLIQKLFLDLEKHLEEATLNPDESFHLEMMIGDLLALYPFFRPDDNDSLKIPVFLNGKWKMIDYTVEKIPLTPRWMGSPIMAFGLTAKDAPPQLLFKATTYPTDKGFGLSLLTDINPISSVGAYAFKIGKNKIGRWLKKNTKTHKALVTGKSLGGAGAWRTALNFPAHVDKVRAYGAPGFSLMDLHDLKKLRKNNTLPEIHMFFQKNDPVPLVDLAARKGVNYYKVVGTKPQKGILAHASMYALHENCVIIDLDASKEAKKVKRFALTALRGAVSLLAFPFLLLTHAVYTTAERTLHCLTR